MVVTRGLREDAIHRGIEDRSVLALGGAVAGGRAVDNIHDRAPCAPHIPHPASRRQRRSSVDQNLNVN